MKNRMWQFEAIVNYLWFAPLLLAIAVVITLAPALPLAIEHPRATAIGAGVLYVVGASCFGIAKVSVIRRGIRVSFGAKPMTRGNRILYRLGYALMFAALAFLAAVAVVMAGYVRT